MKLNQKHRINIEKKQSEDFDREILEYIQPQGGIRFLMDYVRSGTGYEACIQLYDFPTYIETHWLSNVCYFEGAITIVDVTTENEEDALKNIGKSMREYRGRVSAGNDDAGIQDASDTYLDYKELYESVKRYNTVLKSVIVRIFIKARTHAELEERAEQILNKLDSYKGMIMLNEQKYEWESMYLPYKEQQKAPNARIGIPMEDEALAAGDPFHFSFLHDPNGLYLGSTACGGTVNFNMFYKSEIRMYYNVLILGLMGSGKSTLLKKLAHNAYILGDYVRIFDVTGELEHMCEICGMKRINLDGTNGIFNMFQILKVDEDEGICYSRHVAKLDVNYTILTGSDNNQELITYNECVRKMYLKTGINVNDSKENMTELPATSYFTISDFIVFLGEELQSVVSKKGETPAENSLLIAEAERISNIKRTLESVRNNFGRMLDGHTSIDNIMDIKGVVFNIKNIASLPANISNCILYNTLSMCWDNCTRNGMVQKELYETGKISFNDIEHFVIEFDEAHKIMNPRFPVAIQQLTDMQREMRKVFGGLVLATQSVSECIPETDESENTQKIKDLFAFSNYKFIGLHDESLIPKIKRACGSALTDMEYEKIPKLTKGNFILSIQGDKNIQFKVYASNEELDLFRGGL